MSEILPQLQTRLEHSRSVEDAEKYRAIQTLTELGLLIPLVELETYHGREWTQGEPEWRVDPSFKNGGNDSGNSNVNTRPSLYTADRETAQDFADERVGFGVEYEQKLHDIIRSYPPGAKQAQLDRMNKRQQKFWEDDGMKPGGPRLYSMDELPDYDWHEVAYLKEKLGPEDYQKFKDSYDERMRADVHKIVVADPDAVVVDFEFDQSKLDEESLVRYQQALKVLARQTPITEGSPVSFEDRELVAPIVDAIKARKPGPVLGDEVVKIAADLSINVNTVLQVTSAYNSMIYAGIKPAYLVHSLLKHPQDIFVERLEIEGKNEEVPINLEYVQRYLRNAHVVGVKHRVSSATLNRSISSISLLDLEKTTTADALAADRTETWQRLGGMAALLSNALKRDGRTTVNADVLSALTDPYLKPQKLVEVASQVDGYAEIFDADAGNWEGYTLAEHTETVLRNFDENYADKLPVELIAPMRLAILTHDLGKPQAVTEGAKHREKEYNMHQADDFLTRLAVNEHVKNLVLAIIGEGAQLASQINLGHNPEIAQVAMSKLANEVLQAFHQGEEIDASELGAFSEMCKILQVCDGGAYTSMAITRSPALGTRYRNAPSFNRTFAQPLGFGKRSIALRQPSEDAAAHNLAPQSDAAPVSRLRMEQVLSHQKSELPSWYN